jgi:hypothetical protein
MDPRENIYCLRTQATVIKIERKKGRIGLVHHSVYRGAYINLNSTLSGLSLWFEYSSSYPSEAKGGGGDTFL